MEGKVYAMNSATGFQTPSYRLQPHSPTPHILFVKRLLGRHEFATSFDAEQSLTNRQTCTPLHLFDHRIISPPLKRVKAKKRLTRTESNMLVL